MKEIVLMVELKTKVSGLTATLMPGGGSMLALYTELTGPTFVTLLVSVIFSLRFGIVMEGRFTSRTEGLTMEQAVVCPTS